MRNSWLCLCLLVLGCGGSEKESEAIEARSGRELDAGEYLLQDREPDISPDGRRAVFLSAQSGQVQVHAWEADFGAQGVLRLLTTTDLGKPVVAKFDGSGDSVMVWSWKDQKMTLQNVTWDGVVTVLGQDDSQEMWPSHQGVAFSSVVDGLFAYTVGMTSSDAGYEKVYVQFQNGSGLGRYVADGRVIGWAADALWIQKDDQLYVSTGWTGDGQSNFQAETLSLQAMQTGVLQRPYPHWLGSQILSMAHGAWYDVYPVTSADAMSNQSRKYWYLGANKVSWQAQVPGHDIDSWSGSRSDVFGVGVAQIHYVCEGRQDQYARTIVAFSPSSQELFIPKIDLSAVSASPCDEGLDLSVMQVALMANATPVQYRLLWTTLDRGQSRVRLLEVQDGVKTLTNLSAESLSLHLSHRLKN